MDAAIEHCTKGIGIWDWASTDQGCEPDVVIALRPATSQRRRPWPRRRYCARSSPISKSGSLTWSTCSSSQPSTEHPHGLTDRDFDSLFTTDKPMIFNFHGYPWLIHRLAYRRRNQRTCMSAGTRRRGISTRRWSWRSTTRPTASAWQSTPSIAFPGCKKSAGMRKTNSATGRSLAGDMHTNMGSTPRRPPGGGGRNSEEREDSR